MRQAYSDRKWIFDETGKVMGLNLGYDYCAEHEEGIAGIIQGFGLHHRDDVYGIEKRRVRIVPETLYFGKAAKSRRNEKVKYLLHFDPEAGWMGRPLDQIPYGAGLLHPSRDRDGNETFPFATAWDRTSFAVVVYKEQKELLEELYQAILRQDLAIGTSGAMNPFAGSGLLLMIISRMPKEILDRVYEQDKDHHELKLAAEATGIHDLLRKAGKHWFALSPRWADEKKTEVIFFLNPREQDKYNHGWFTVEDLKEWAKDRGKVLKEKRA